ncbi:MATE family efflux transporter [Terrisporobacter mayombei]|uniref:Multidrug export protein MepA n=1 Tax=Terrisporobacter mayombei TaxID=1541 RepID=A0ABY9PYI5_9FIRM|nr:MATE family efflux transporter [Terrisporobacter mayombei]MCC3868594.1 MATE family efflux transporter [Terrisporobacter mayombei]WMT80751.1 Multidrug export protein MepA [Terrisporobacter mayombei]
MDSKDTQFEKMTKTPIPQLVSSLAVPTIISMLITSLYNMADTYFVSQLGTSASAATGIVFSLMAIIQAVAFAIGIGSGSTISRKLGQQNKEDADILGSSGFVTALIFGSALLIFGNIFIKPLMILLGSTETILPYAVNYAKYILFAAPFMTASFALNNMLRAEGKANFAMVGIGIGGIINIILDPIFIFHFNLGISGAAIATAISQFLSFIVLFLYYLKGKTIVRFSINKISKEINTYLIIFKNGMPSFFRQGLASVATVALNFNAANYGDSAVAAMSIVGRVFMLIFCVIVGYGQGYQPVVGYNYGAKNFTRVKESFLFTLKIGTTIMTVLALMGYILSPQIMSWFISDLSVIEIGTRALRYQCLVMPLMTLGVISNMTFQAVGKSLHATFLTSCRQGIFFLPLIIILPKIFYLKGVEITQPISDVLTFIVSIPFIYKFFKNLNNNNRAE